MIVLMMVRNRALWLSQTKKCISHLNCNPMHRITQRRGMVNKSDETNIHSVKDHIVEKTPITAQLWQMRKNAIDADRMKSLEFGTGLALAPKLMTKTTAESRLTLGYNFSKDSSLRDLYVDHIGDILIGKLFEDLDALAGNIAYNHCDDENPITDRLNMVTASVDKIVQRKPITTRQDLIITGQVAWVGRTSMDVVIEVHNAADVVVHTDTTVTTDDSSGVPIPAILEPNSPSRLLSSFFTYAARDRATGKSAPVNHLKPMNANEEIIVKEREALAVERKTQQQNLNPCREEILRLVEAGSAIVDMPALAHPNAVLMKYTGLENTLVCNPQNSNVAGRVFGGFIMHRAYDLALATCYIFAGVYPVFSEVDQIQFKKPVDIGDLLRLRSRVIYTSDAPIRPVVVIEVNCQVVRPERASSFVSNTFHFVFTFPNTSVTLRKVLPTTAEEASTLLAGARSVQ